MLYVKSLKNKTILVTGSSRGIGKEIAYSFLNQGCKVVGISNKKNIFSKNKKGKYFHFKCDLENEDNLKNCLINIKKKIKKIDVVINNASVSLQLIKNLNEDMKNFKKTLNVNLSSAFYIAYFFSKLMREKKIKGKILNISSIGAKSAFSNNPGYTSSKSGLLALTKSIAIDFGKYGITSNAILPGYFNIGMTSKSSKKLNIKKQRLNRILLNRYGKVEELVNLIIFLASDYSKYITGQEITIDGGFLVNSSN